MRKVLLVCAVAILPIVTVADQPRPSSATPTTATPTPRISQAQLNALRDSLLAQIAARDAAEGTMRAPTPEEAAALTATKKTTRRAEVIRLKSGGTALRTDQSSLSLAIATVDEQGRVTVGHGAVETKGGTR